MCGRAPRLTFSTLASPSGGQWYFDLWDELKLPQHVTSLISIEEQSYKQEHVSVSEYCFRHHLTGSSSEMTNLDVGFVPVARVRRTGLGPKLWHIIGTVSPHLYPVQSIVSEGIQIVHVMNTPRP